MATYICHSACAELFVCSVLHLLTFSQANSTYNESEYSQLVSLELLLDVVYEAPQEYVLSFSSFPLAAATFEKSNLFFDRVICPTRILAGNDTKDVKISELFHRFVFPFNIILAEYSLDSWTASFDTYHNLFYQSGNVFMHYFFGNDPSEFEPYHPKILSFPAIKIKIVVTDQIETIELIFRCCVEEDQMSRDTPTVSMLMNPRRFHRNFFWGCGGRKINTFSSSNEKDIAFEYNYNDPGICIENVATANNNYDTKNCHSFLMIPMVLGKVHNFTLKLIDSFDEDFATAVKSEEKITHNSMFTKIITPVARLFFGGSSEYYPVYCGKVSRHLEGPLGDYQVWTNAFSVKVWLIHLAWVLIMIYLLGWTGSRRTQFLREFYNVYSLGIGQELQAVSSPTNKPCQFLIMFFGFVIRNFYENTITSILVAPERPALYQNLSDLILDDVKIFNLPEGNEDILQSDFDRAGVLDKLGSSLMYYKIEDENDESVLHFLQPSNKVKHAFLSQARGIKRTEYTTTLFIANYSQDDGVSCHALRDGVNKQFGFWEILLTNVEYLRLTMQRISDAGLDSAWDRWAQDLEFLESKIKFRRVEQTLIGGMTNDVINLEKIRFALIICSIMSVASAMLFIAEICGCLSLTTYLIIKVRQVQHLAWFTKKAKIVNLTHSSASVKDVTTQAAWTRVFRFPQFYLQNFVCWRAHF